MAYVILKLFPQDGSRTTAIPTSIFSLSPQALLTRPTSLKKTRYQETKDQEVWLPCILPSLRKPAQTYVFLLSFSCEIITRPKITHFFEASSLCKISVSTKLSLHSSVLLHSALLLQNFQKFSSCLHLGASLKDPELTEKENADNTTRRISLDTDPSLFAWFISTILKNSPTFSG